MLVGGGKVMTIEAMERFAVLARHKSFSKAAEELYLSQSTLSRQIMELEKELGCTLILRSGKGIVLSDAGRLFNRYAINALNENARFRVELSRLNICDDHRARIGYTTRGHHGILQQGIQQFPQNIHEYHFLQANPPRIAAMLNEGTLDCALMHRASAELLNEAVTVRKISDCLLSVLVPEGNPLYGRERLLPRELSCLSGMTWLTYDRQLAPHLYDRQKAFLNSHHVVPLQTLVMEDFDAILLNAMTVNGFVLGAGIEPQYPCFSRILVQEELPWLDLVFVFRKDAATIAEQFYYMLLDRFPNNAYTA